jgi:hypothetical protein
VAKTGLKGGWLILAAGSLLLLGLFFSLAIILELHMKAVMAGALVGVGATYAGYLVHLWALDKPFSLQMKVIWGGILARLLIFFTITGLLYKLLEWPVAALVLPMIAAYVFSTLIEGIVLGRRVNNIVSPAGCKRAGGNSGGRRNDQHYSSSGR